MDAAGVLVRASCPDPKRVKAGFAPFHIAADGVTTTSASGEQSEAGHDTATAALSILPAPPVCRHASVSALQQHP
jgi:hypothetical protein